MKFNYDFDYFKKSADFVLDKIGGEVRLGLILGSSLGFLTDEMENTVTISYEDIPNFLESTVESHAGELVVGNLYGKRIACMSGRFHSYEGYDHEQLVIPIRVLKLIGVETVIITNIAGAVNPNYSAGDTMLIKDHIKLMGHSPLRGRNVPEFGPRFFDTTEMYPEELRNLAKQCAINCGVKLQEGVYFFYNGPQIETPAEIKAISILGGDATGMSTVSEALAAAHCGMKVLGLSLMSNMAAGVGQPVVPDENKKTVQAAAEDFKKLVAEILKELN